MTGFSLDPKIHAVHRLWKSKHEKVATIYATITLIIRLQQGFDSLPFPETIL